MTEEILCTLPVALAGEIVRNYNHALCLFENVVCNLGVTCFLLILGDKVRIRIFGNAEQHFNF